jgi:hypothetical protein
MIDFTDKKVLFYGPALTLDKEHLHIDDYDYTIITNNMVSIFFQKYTPQQTKVILYANALYIANYFNHIQEHYTKLHGVIVVCESHAQKIRTLDKTIPVIVNSFRLKGKAPLGLTRVLDILQKSGPFQKLYIIGVTFYENKKTIQNNYEPNYITELGKKYNILQLDRNTHSLTDNIQFTQDFVKRFAEKVDMCPKARNKLKLT